MPYWASPTAVRVRHRCHSPWTGVAGYAVESVNTRDSVKLGLAGGASAMFRALGTEPVVRVYVEAQTPEQVRAILDEATPRMLVHDLANTQEV